MPVIMNVTHLRNQSILSPPAPLQKKEKEKKSRTVVSMLCFPEIEILQIFTKSFIKSNMDS